MISALSFTISIVAYGVAMLQKDGKLKLAKGLYGFWDEKSDRRKYKKDWSKDPLGYDRFPAPDNFYYKYIARVKYKERWFTSSNLTVALTDGFHASQHVAFLAMAFGISQLINIYGVWDFPLIWGAILLIHWLTRRILSK